VTRMNTFVEPTLLKMFRDNVKYEDTSIRVNSCSVLKHMNEESDVKLHSASFFYIVSLFVGELGPTFNQLCDSAGRKKSCGLRAQPRMHHIFHFLEYEIDRSSRNVVRKLQFYVA
jgi:hypothetical protein